MRVQLGRVESMRHVARVGIHPRNRLVRWAGSWLQPPSSRTNLSLPAAGCEDSPIGRCGVSCACSTAAACI